MSLDIIAQQLYLERQICHLSYNCRTYCFMLYRMFPHENSFLTMVKTSSCIVFSVYQVDNVIKCLIIKFSSFSNKSLVYNEISLMLDLLQFISLQLKSLYGCPTKYEYVSSIIKNVSSSTSHQKNPSLSLSLRELKKSIPDTFIYELM